MYGALHCGKIYSVFLPMPGKSWVLQYCARNQPAPKPTESRGVVQLGQAVSPPDPQERFDFKRLPVPEIKADKQIVLHGYIRADGAVEEMKVLQGILSEMDEAAVAAFSRWKFKPAVRAGAPVALEILIGIPVTAPAL